MAKFIFFRGNLSKAGIASKEALITTNLARWAKKSEAKRNGTYAMPGTSAKEEMGGIVV